MSIVPFCSSGMRLAEVTACRFTFRSLRPVAFFTASTTRSQISKPKPTGCALSFRYENGIDDSRYASVIWPDCLTLSSVDAGCAMSQAGAARASSGSILRAWIRIDLPFVAVVRAGC